MQWLTLAECLAIPTILATHGQAKKLCLWFQDLGQNRDASL